jgi:N-acetylneuraminic acid mutarotase
VLSGISGAYEVVWAYPNQAWQVYDPNDQAGSTLASMQVGMGYWIKMISAKTLSVSGSSPPSSVVSLSQGWNLAGSIWGSCTPTSTAFSSLSSSLQAVWGYASGSWQVYDQNDPAGSTLSQLCPNYGYWMNVSQAGTLKNAAPPPPTAPWQTKTSMPTGRFGLGIGVVNGTLYAVGGDGGETTVEEYNPAADTWTTKSPMPTYRFDLGIGVANNKIYAIGGWIGGYGNPPLATVEEYNPATDTWTTKSSMPTARENMGIGVIGSNIYAVGGDDTVLWIPFATLEVYDANTDTWTTKSPMPTARGALSVGVANGKLYAIGGATWTPGGGNSSIVEEYDPATDTWTTKSPMPTGRNNLSVGVVNSKIYAVGGNGATVTFLPTVEEYDPATDTWSTKTPMPTGRCSLAIGAVNSKIYAVGGVGGMNLNQQYDPALDP